MATTLYFNLSQTHPGAGSTDVYRDMTVARGSGATLIAVRTTADENGEYPLANPGLPAWRFYSERVSAEVTIAGSVTFNLWGTRNVQTGFVGKWRARLYKITDGGSNIETFICQADASANISGANGVAVLYNFSATPATAVTLGANERLICRPSVVLSSGALASSNVQLNYSGVSAGVAADTWVQLTETVTMLSNALPLYLRRTNTIGISTYFDMTLTRGSSAATTGVVNTVTGPALIPWTRTAGGTALGWITPRVGVSGWNIASANYMGALVLYAQESASQANAQMVAHLYKRTAGGSLVLLAMYPGIAELTTSALKYTMTLSSGLAGSPEDCQLFEDDRLVLVPSITDFGTMGSGRTCTLTYDHNVAAATGDCFMSLNDPPLFKLESDPLATGIVTNGGMLGGVANGL